MSEESSSTFTDTNDNIVSDRVEVVQKKRLQAIGFIFILVFAVVVGRLTYIQVIQGDDYAKKAVQQRMVSIPVDINRGAIYDRNMIPFTDREIKKTVIVYPAYIQNKQASIETISKACGIPEATVASRINGSSDTVEFISQYMDNEYLRLIESSRLKGVIAVEKELRYSPSGIAKHAIGYISKTDKKGQMGIEKSMNSFLSGSASDSIIAVVDSSKNIIPGLGFRKVEVNKDGLNYSVKLTLDYHIQKIVEDVMKKNNVSGSVVVMDVSNGDIVGMASMPDFDQDNLDKYLNSSGNELINKSVWEFDFGSIFKTVVAAAAFENKIITPDFKTRCTGSIKSGNTTIKCSTYSTHKDRELDVKSGFALSCNTEFVTIGTKVGAEKILDMAKRFGFGQKQCPFLPEEKAGYIPTPQEDGIGNISIGQGKIQVTPLQVTSMMATIADDGIRHAPNLVDSLLDSNGIVVKKLDRSKPEVIVSPSTCAILKDMLLEVTRTGTAKQANMDEYGGCSGKTSTAETGINSGEVTHGWFAGFFPSNAPQYAMTVFVYNGQSGGKAAAPIFKEIAVRMLEEVKK